MDPTVAHYKRLHKEAKHWKGKQPEIPNLRLTSTDKPCNRKVMVGYGTMIPCSNSGYVQLGNVIFCKQCFKDFQGGMVKC